MDCYFWPGFLNGDIPIYDGGSTLLTYSWDGLHSQHVYTPTVEREAGWIGWRDLAAGDWVIRTGRAVYCKDNWTKSVYATVSVYRALVDSPSRDSAFPGSEWELVPAGLLNSPTVTQTMRGKCSSGSWTDWVLLHRHTRPALGQDFGVGDAGELTGSTPLYFTCLESRAVAGAPSPLMDHDHWARVPLMTIWPRLDVLAQTMSPDPMAPNQAASGVGLHFDWRKMYRGCAVHWTFAHDGVELADYIETWALDEDGKHSFDTTWENDGWISGLPARPDTNYGSTTYHLRPLYTGVQRTAPGRWSSYGPFGGSIHASSESPWGLADISEITATATNLTVRYRVFVPWSEASVDGVTWGTPFGDFARVDATMEVNLSSEVTLQSVFDRLFDAIDPDGLGTNQQRRYEVIGPLDPLDEGESITPLAPEWVNSFIPPWGVSVAYPSAVGHAVNTVVMGRGIFGGILWPWRLTDWLAVTLSESPSFKCSVGDVVEIVPRIDRYENLLLEYRRLPEEA